MVDPSSEAPTTPTHADGPLVSTQWLEDHLDDPSVAIFEVSIDPLPAAGYPSGHAPGAQFIYWKDLLWHETDREFVTPEALAARLGQLGIGEATTIALMGAPLQFAVYAYWVMTMAGQEHRCFVVDGGRKTWLAEGRPLTTDVITPAPKSIRPGSPDPTSRVGRAEVLAGLDGDGPVLVDMRSPEEYNGERVSPSWKPFDHGAERKGHIPGARHVFFDELLTESGTLLEPDALAARFDAVGATEGTDVVTYCRLSHRGSSAWFILTRILGRKKVRVYDGSWTEWGSIVGYPIER